MVSVCIIAKDASRTLAESIASVQLLTDDIVVVVDTASRDTTLDIAKQQKVKTIEHSFSDFSTQKNFAATLAKYDWIFSLDADEQATPLLVNQIKEALSHPQHSCYRIKRINYIFGKPIHHTNWDPHGLIRVYNRKLAHWDGKVHEHIVTVGSVGSLPGVIIHDNYRTVEEFLSRMNFYTTKEAEQLNSQGIKSSKKRMIWYPIKDFLRRYIRHAGFMDGLHGLYLSILMSMYHFSTEVKLWQKQHGLPLS